MLGTLEISDHPRLEGSLEGDVVTTAVLNALLGAAGLEEPSRDGRAGPASGELSTDTESAEEALRNAVRKIERHNYQVVNLHITIVSERIPVAPHARRLKDNLAALVHVAPTHVAIQATGGHGAPWLETQEAAAIAVALLDQIADLDSLHASIRSGG